MCRRTESRMSRKGLPSVWFLVLFPWLVQGQLGPSPSPPGANDYECPPGYAWAEVVEDCIGCSACIEYPNLSYCSTVCSEFIQQVPNSEVNMGVEEGDGQSSGHSTKEVLIKAAAIGVGFSLLFWVLCVALLIFTKTRAKTRKKPLQRKKSENGKTISTDDDVPDPHLSERTPDLHGANILTCPRKSSFITLSDFNSDIRSQIGKIGTFGSTADSDSTQNTITKRLALRKRVHFVPDRIMSDSDSDIQPPCIQFDHSICSSTVTADSGYCTDDVTQNTIAQMSLKKSILFVPDRIMSDSNFDISMGKTRTRSSTADSECCSLIVSTPSNSMTEMSQWEEESYDAYESSDTWCSRTNIASSSCNSVVCFSEALIGKDGGILSVPNAATSLLFSPHSISNQIDITLEILHNPVVLPDLMEDETLVSPFVCCGPRWIFHKPVLLTFPHCGLSDKSHFTLLVSETTSQQSPNWEEVSDATPGIEYFVRDSECLVYTNHFTGFSLKSSGPKQVRLLAFSSMSDNLYRLKVYCINDTKDVVDRIKKEEQEYGFKPTDRGISMTFLNNKKDIYLKADLETPGWKFLNGSQLVISYDSVRGKREGNFVMFKLQAEPKCKRDTRILSLSINAFQEGNSDSPTYSVGEEMPIGKLETTTSPPSHHRCDHRGACNCRTQSQVYMLHTNTTNQARVSILNYQGSHRNLMIPHKLRTQLCIKLDPATCRGNDWRSLASELGLDELIEYFGSKGNPTELVLQEFDKSKRTLKELWSILIVIGRPDAASLVDEYIGKLHSPLNFSDSGVGSPDTDREASGTDSTPSAASDVRFFPNSPSRAAKSFKDMSQTDPPPYMHLGGSVPLHGLYNSSQDATTTSQPNNPPYVHLGGSVPSQDLYNSSQHATCISQSSSPQYLQGGGSVPSKDLYRSSHAISQTSTPPPGSDIRFFPNGTSRAISQTDPPQYMHCGGSVPSQGLYNSSHSAIFETNSPRSLHCGGSVPSRDLYDSGQATFPQTNLPQYINCGGSVPLHTLYNSYEDLTEPKLTQAIESMQDLALNNTARNNKEPGNTDDQESTKAPEDGHTSLPDGCRETDV